MTRISLLLLFLYPFFFELSAQKAVQKMSDDACKCLNKHKKDEDLDTENLLKYCIEEGVGRHLLDLKKEYEVISMQDIDINEIGSQIGIRLAKECKYFQELITAEFGNDSRTDSLDKRYEKAQIVNKETCRNFVKGEFYYAIPMDSARTIMDTTFLTINGTLYLERMDNGKTFSLLSFKWVNDCTFEITFIESNHPIKAAMSKKGDKYTYTIMEINEDRAMLKSYFMGLTDYLELVKRQ